MGREWAGCYQRPPSFPFSHSQMIGNRQVAQDMLCTELSPLDVASHLNITTTQGAGIAHVPPTLQMNKLRRSEVKLSCSSSSSTEMTEAGLKSMPGWNAGNTVQLSLSPPGSPGRPPPRATSLGTLPHSPFPSWAHTMKVPCRALYSRGIYII